MASKKAYIIMHKETGNVLQSVAHEKLAVPIMTLSKTKCLILENPSQATYFDETQGIKKQVVFRVDPGKALSTIVI